MKNFSIPAVLGCVLGGGYWFCITCDAQIVEPRSVAPENPDVRAAADLLVRQLSPANKIEVRENAAIALQAMGKNAAKALATYIRGNLSEHNGGGIKAITVLGKIGNDLADDDYLRDALWSAASLPLQSNWPELQLAAIDALREINKYRGVILTLEDDNRPDTFDPDAAIGCADLLAQTAEKVFEKSTVRSVPTPTPTPPDEEFYAELKILRDSQAKLLKAAAHVSAAASPSKPEEPVFSRLTDAKTLAESLKRIEVGYSDATKIIDTQAMQKLKLENTYDKTAWQFQTEAAYDLLTETRELRDQLQKALSTFKKSQDDLAALVSALARISANSNSEVIEAAVARAISEIFSKPPKKKPATEGAKKKEGEKKDADKKDSPAAKGAHEKS